MTHWKLNTDGVVPVHSMLFSDCVCLLSRFVNSTETNLNEHEQTHHSVPDVGLVMTMSLLVPGAADRGSVTLAAVVSPVVGPDWGV